MSFVSACDVNAANLVPSGPPKQWTQNGVSFTHTYMSHNYGTPQAPQTSGALIELSITKARIKRKVDQNGKEEWKLIVILTSPTDIRGCDQVDLGLKNAAYKYRVQLATPNFNVENPGPVYRSIYFYPSDSETGILVEGADPMMAMKLNNQSKFEILIDTEGHTQAVDYHALEGKELTASIIFSPRLYRPTGANKTILAQPVVRSCMIVGMSDAGAVDHTKSETVRAFLSQNPDIINTLAGEIEKLKLGQSSSLLQTTSMSNSAPNAQPSNGQVVFASDSSPQGNQSLPTIATNAESNPSASPPRPAQPAQLPAVNSMPQPQQPTIEFALPSLGAQPSMPTNQPSMPTLDLNAYINSGQQAPTGITLQRI